jgi:hypothetical protein
VQVAGAVVFAVLWKLWNRRGPLEELVAMLSERHSRPQLR